MTVENDPWENCVIVGGKTCLDMCGYAFSYEVSAVMCCMMNSIYWN